MQAREKAQEISRAEEIVGVRKSAIYFCVKRSLCRKRQRTGLGSRGRQNLQPFRWGKSPTVPPPPTPTLGIRSINTYSWCELWFARGATSSVAPLILCVWSYGWSRRGVRALHIMIVLVKRLQTAPRITTAHSQERLLFNINTVLKCFKHSLTLGKTRGETRRTRASCRGPPPCLRSTSPDRRSPGRSSAPRSPDCLPTSLRARGTAEPRAWTEWIASGGIQRRTEATASRRGYCAGSWIEMNPSLRPT